MTDPMPGAPCWAHAETEDSEEWSLAFSSERECLEDGYRTYPGAFWVREAKYADPADYVKARSLYEDVVEAIEEEGAEECARDETLFRARDRSDAVIALEKVLRAWSRAHLVPLAWIPIGEPVRIAAKHETFIIEIMETAFLAGGLRWATPVERMSVAAASVQSHLNRLVTLLERNDVPVPEWVKAELRRVEEGK